MKIEPPFHDRTLLVGFAIALLFSGLSGTATLAQTPPGPAQLKELCQALHSAIIAGDEAKAAGITRALLPDKPRLQRALSDEVNPETLQKLLAFYEQLPKDAPHLARLLQAKPEQKEVMVHAATTEDLVRYAQGTLAYAEFPRAASDLAKQKVLRPGATYYEVEFLEPGKDAGMKYHLFFWDGSAWTMLGPIWRALR